MDVAKLIQLKPEEDIMLVRHQSLAAWALPFLTSALWITLPFFLLYPLLHMQTFGFFLFMVWLASGILYTARVVYRWEKSVFIVTDHRVIDIDQCGFFHRRLCEAPYRTIGDVSYEVQGFWQTVFRYGTLTVTVGTDALEVFFLPKPAVVHDLILDLREAHATPNIPPTPSV